MYVCKCFSVFISVHLGTYRVTWYTLLKGIDRLHTYSHQITHTRVHSCRQKIVHAKKVTTQCETDEQSTQLSHNHTYFSADCDGV